MRSDGGLDDNEIDKWVSKGVIDQTDAAILRGMVGAAQATYLEALLDKRQADKERGHPHS